MWQITNKKIGKLGKGQEIWLQSEDGKITQPQVADALKSYFTDKAEELVEKNSSKSKDTELKKSNNWKSKFDVFLANIGSSHRSIKIKAQSHSGM
jgi:hypothetical protein